MTNTNHQTLFRTTTDDSLELVLLVSVELKSKRYSSSSTEEMIRLIESAGGTVASEVTQSKNAPDFAYFVGSGKAEEIASEASSNEITTIVFNHNLSPGQVNRLEEITLCKVIDRTELILSIFAVQARTPQAKLRIELAQLEYMLPRLSGMWHHLDRLGAGIGTRGPGETQLEVDRRRARARIKSLERKLNSFEASVKVRSSNRDGMFKVALAGYTNAGKSTLLNNLCDTDLHAEDKLFATLDSSTRKLDLPNGGSVVLSDTVGFIKDLPESLYDSFRSTLDVITDADLILLVADVADSERLAKVTTVKETLEQLKADNIERVTVWNKSDLTDISDKSEMAVSAITGYGISDLLLFIEKKRRAALQWSKVTVGVEAGNIEFWIRQNGIIHSINRDEETGSVEIICGVYLGYSYLRKKLSQLKTDWEMVELSSFPKAEGVNGSVAVDG